MEKQIFASQGLRGIGLLMSFLIIALSLATINLNAQNVGIDVDPPLSKLHVNGGILATGTTGGTPVSGAGTRLMWIPADKAFRAGMAQFDEWDEYNIGNYSFAFGQDVRASNTYAVCFGEYNIASGYWSFTSGYENHAQADLSYAFGHNIHTGSFNSFVIGRYNEITGNLTSWVDTDPLFIVGNGTSSTNNNAFTIYKNGKTEIDGDLDITGIFSGDGSGLTNLPVEYYWSRSGNYVYNSSDSIGIRTSTPHAALEVNGRIEIRGTGGSVFIGENAGPFDDLDDNQNTFIGYWSGRVNSYGHYNVGVGSCALQSNNANCNTAVGAFALRVNQNGYNTALGYYPLTNFHGDSTIAIGVYAGKYLTNGSNNILIGTNSGPNVNEDWSNTIWIGKSNENIPVIFGNQINGNIALGNTNPLERLHVVGGINLGNTTNTNPGTIRWSGTDFEGYNGSAWKSLTVEGDSDWVVSNDSLFRIVGSDTLITFTDEGKMGLGTTHPAYQLDLTATMHLPATTGADTGVIYKDGLPFLHTYRPLTSSGGNIFIGRDAGNFTMAGNSSQCRRNIGIGENALHSLTSGTDNVGIGHETMKNNTGGYCNASLGDEALWSNANGYYNVALGYRALQYNDGENNVGVGTFALNWNSTGTNNVGVGYSTLSSNVSGENNIALGYRAGVNLSDGDDNILIGVNVNTPTSSSNSKLNIGNTLYGDMSTDKIGIGVVSPAECLDLNGALKLGNTSSSNTGTIRWTGTDFEGYNGSAWKSLTVEGDNDWTISGSDMYASVSGNVGVGTSSPSAKLHINNGVVLATGVTGSTPISGAGTRLMWIPQNQAFRCGAVTGSNWDAGYIGQYSFASGFNTKASGQSSFAGGRSCTASGTSSISMGLDCLSFGLQSISLGYQNQSMADYSVAIGSINHSTELNAITLGGGNTASNNYAIAMGGSSNASGYASVAIGDHATATGNYGVALGLRGTAQSYCSFVTGRYNVISGTTTSWVDTEPLFIIGNGADASNRNNALTVYKNGNTEIDGDLDITGVFTGDGSGLTNLPGDSDWTISGSDMYASVSGNVGIGASSPITRLTVAAESNNDAALFNGPLGGDVLIGMRTNLSGGSFNNEYILRSAQDGSFQIVDGRSFDADYSGTARLTIDNAGSIGIGTITPGSKLHIFSTDWDDHLTLERAANPPGHISIGTNNMVLWVGSGTGMYIGSTGNIGIGAAPASSKLFVDGDLSLQNGTSVNEFSMDTTLAGNSDDAVPTEKAVKTYVDNMAYVPVGSIIAWAKHIGPSPLTLSENFVECNGQVLDDDDSPLDGYTMPDLNGTGVNDQRFLRGSSTSGATGGNEEHSHTVNGMVEESTSYMMVESGTTVQVNTGDHQHNLNITSGNSSSLPPYYEVVWIIRVK